MTTKPKITDHIGYLKKTLDQYEVFRLLCFIRGRYVQDVLDELIKEYLTKNKKIVRIIKKARK